MSDKRIRDELHTMLFAGSDTTANTLSWMFLKLAENPSMLDRYANVSDDGRALVTSIALRYSTLKETLWMLLPTHLKRLATAPRPSVRCIAEADSLYDNGGDLSPESLNRTLPFLTACFTEALRLFPPAAAARPHLPERRSPSRLQVSDGTYPSRLAFR